MKQRYIKIITIQLIYNKFYYVRVRMEENLKTFYYQKINVYFCRNFSLKWKEIKEDQEDREYKMKTLLGDQEERGILILAKNMKKGI